jgi:tRNA pseudouridine55 synthase
MTTIATPDGILLVDKPANVSSHDMALAVRWSLGQRSVGHSGTLDPFATGLLVMLVGRATRLLRYIDDDPKIYEASIRFGTETDTQDLHGAVTKSASLPSRDAVSVTLPSLTGMVSHVPPAYSAKRVKGRRAYDMARQGIDVELEPVTVRVDSWEVLGWDGDTHHVERVRVRLQCSGGTYVRALAQELARRAGSAAHLDALRRTAIGPFSVNGAATLHDLRERRAMPRPVLDALPHLPREIIDAAFVAAVVRGQTIPATVEGARAAIVNAENGVLVAVAERRDDRWQPRVVMRPAENEKASA